jgi:hypothetical protein
MASWRPKADPRPAIAPVVQVSINEVLLGYWRHAEAYYRDMDGKPTSQAGIIRRSLRPLRELYGFEAADDCDIYVQSQAAGERVLAPVTRFLEERLKLRVNRSKSAVASVMERKFLGHRLLEDGTQTIAPQSLDRARDRVRAITRCNRGVSFEQLVTELNTFLTGWVDYFRHAKAKGVLSDLGGLGSSQTTLRSSEATEAGQINHRLLAWSRGSLGPMLDDGGERQGLVADGSYPRRPGGDE